MVYCGDLRERTGSPEKSELLYINAWNMIFMAETNQNPSALRLFAALLLGIAVAFIIFFIFALGIGFINQSFGMSVPVTLDFRENMFSAVLLGALVLICIAGFVWMVYKTPPASEEIEKEHEAEEEEEEK
jgi:hypothetical protein